MKSPDDDFNWIIRAGIAVWITSLVAMLAFGVWIGVRLQ